MNGRIARVGAWAETPRAKRLGRVARVVFFIVVAAALVWQLRNIGWREVLRELPTTPWFYILFVANFLTLPVSELFVFRRLLGRPMRGMLPVFVRKRILNAALVGYSGEVYLYAVAKARLGLPAKAVLLALKDNAILSSLAGAVMTAVFLGLFVAAAPAGQVGQWFASTPGVMLAIALSAAFVLPLALRFRRQIFTAGAAVLGGVFAIHLVRTVIVLLLQATQWAVVIPDEPWRVWIVFLTAQMVISRLPLLPNRDLLFLSAGLEMANALPGPRAAMAGMLLAGGALTQGANLLFFAITALWLGPPQAAPIEEDGETLPGAA